MLAATTPITIEFPTWFYGVFSLATSAFVCWAVSNFCKMKVVCEEFPKIRRALDLISQKLFEKGFFKEQVFVSSASPLKLTEAGIQLLTDSHFEDFFKVNKEHFFKTIDSKNPKNPFEVENTSRELMLYLDLDKTPKSDLIKTYSYNSGRATGDILTAYSVAVRDRYLKEHPEIK